MRGSDEGGERPPALLISTTQWALLGAAAGSSYAGLGTGVMGLEVPLDVPIGEALRQGVRIRKGSLTERVHRGVRWRLKMRPKP